MSAAAAGRAVATAPANIAFVKYWGARDLGRALPLNPSISMTLAACVSRTAVEVLPGTGDDEVWWAAGVAAVADPGAPRHAPAAPFAARVRRQLDNLRRRAGSAARLRVVTANSFPAAAGIASSASGFAALTVAAAAALGLDPSPGELSSLARESGSGSAARSVLGGYVEWPDPAGADPDDPRAVQLAPPEHWALRDVVAVVAAGPKEVSSLEGHRRAPGSPHFARRLELLPGRLERVRAALRDRDLAALGTVVEEEAVELHLVAMSSRPPIFYWAPASLAVLAAVRELRAAGVGAWASFDAGANAHVLCEPADEAAVADRLGAVAGVRELLRDGVGPGPRLEEVGW